MCGRYGLHIFPLLLVDKTWKMPECTAIVEDDIVAHQAMESEMMATVGFCAVSSATRRAHFLAATGCDLLDYGYPFDLEDEFLFSDWLQHYAAHCGLSKECSDIAEWLRIAFKYRATAVIQ